MLTLTSTSLGSKIAILGFWKEWQSSMRFLLSQNFTNITILDKKEDIWTIPKNISSQLWDTYLDNIHDFDLIIKSPWVSPYAKEYNLVQNKFISQTQIFFEYYQWKVIGITGTKWKSTVSSLLEKSLKNLNYKTKLVGNIWTPVLDEIDINSVENYDYIIYEMSSYMLDWYNPPLHIWYINNIYECHLDWHQDMINYSRAKENILKNAKHTITHKSISKWDILFPSQDWFSYKDDSIYYKDEIFLECPEKILIWEHNMLNICWVLSLLQTIISEIETLKDVVRDTLKVFSPLHHRLENIGTYKWITFIDDGAAVTPDATIWAINALGSSVETLLIWWKDLQTSHQELLEIISSSTIKNIVLFPDTGYKIFSPYNDEVWEEEVFEFSYNNTTLKSIKTKSMESAVKFCYTYTSPNKIVLLSSAAQSYSLWKSFEEKWMQYKKYINQYAAI